MLTKRLAACAAMVTPGGVVCDVGTDHAYLPAYLLTHDICTRAVVTDIHQGPLEAARRTLTQAGVLPRAELLLCDGLQAVQPGEITDVVIAGMGGETIIHILECCQWKQQVKLILQPMTKAALLRQWLAKNGYAGWQETVAAEGVRYYPVICARYTGKNAELSVLEQEVGCLNYTEAAARAYANRKLERFRAVEAQLTHAGNPEAITWKRLVDVLEQKLEEIEKC